MRRVSKGLASGIVAGAVLLGHTGRAAAQATTTSRPPTTVTTTTSTTSTTLSPHKFSAATAACISRARADFRACRREGDESACQKQYQAAFPKCFAAPAGVKCATTCVTKETTCLTAVPKTKKSCRKTCATTRKRDVRACRQIADGDNIWAAGDAACLATAAANLDLCRFVCTQAEFDCRVSLRFCIANCANL